MVANELKTKIQLEALVRAQMEDAQIFHLEVRSEPTFGWGAFIVADPAKAGEYQARVDRIVRELRGKFDLKL